MSRKFACALIVTAAVLAGCGAERAEPTDEEVLRSLDERGSLSFSVSASDAGVAPEQVLCLQGIRGDVYGCCPLDEAEFAVAGHDLLRTGEIAVYVEPDCR